MWRNYIKVTLRNLARYKQISFINIFGLSVGLACCITLMLYSIHEFSFDRFHEDSERMYRMYRWTESMAGRSTQGDPHLPLPLAPALKEEFPDVEYAIRWKEAWGKNFIKTEKFTDRIEITYVDKEVFEVFNFPLKYGSKEYALAKPNNVVLTESIALKLFNAVDIIGETVELKIDDAFQPFIISAIVNDPPSNSSKQFELLASMDHFATTASGQRRVGNWQSSFLSVFVKLKEGSDLADNEAPLHRFRQKYYPTEEADLRADGVWTQAGHPITYRLQAFQEMHTDPKVLGGDIPPIDPLNIWILIGIACGILLIAIINFTTIAIGRANSRVKEVGVRKIIGSSRKALILQFVVEAFVVCCISLLFALLLAVFFLPYFNELSNRSLVLSFQAYPSLLFGVLGITLVTALLVGIYPALLLSKLQPIDIIRNRIKIGNSNWLTKFLVTTQFSLSSGLIIATLIILNQLNFIQNENLGFDEKNIVVLDAEGIEKEKIYPILKENLLKESSIRGVASTDMSIGASMGWSTIGFDYKGTIPKDAYEYTINNDYLALLEIPLIAGRRFSDNLQNSTNPPIIVNESLVKDFGWETEEAIGQKLEGYSDSTNTDPQVIGVVKDFHFRSFREAIKPQIFYAYNEIPDKFLVRLEANNFEVGLEKIEYHWKNLVPNASLKYTFLEDDIGRFYQSEKRQSKIVGGAGAISIFLACLGLLGLISIATMNRMKEVSIRKVLGANVLHIILLLNKNFLALVIVALAISAPIVYYLMQKWLQNFAYHIETPWWIFFMVGLVVILIAAITISFHSIKAAFTNPINSLRNE